MKKLEELKLNLGWNNLGAYKQNMMYLKEIL